LGHGAGDDLIRQVAQRLRAAVREGDLVARLGGDEFAVLVPNVRDDADVAALCDRLLASFREPFCLVGSDVSVGASVGVVLTPRDGSRRDELMRRADIALYRMKTQGRGTYRFFSPEMDESLQLRRRVEADLREALATDQLELAYQPLYEPDGATVRSVEALARWTHPERGPIAPSFFVSVAEDSDLIHALGEWVLRRACRDAARWPGLTVAVNLSPRQIRSASFPRLLARVLAEAGLEPSRLEFEVTEGVLMDDSGEARQVLGELRAGGLRIALDDFGTGYSSLSYLRRFDFDRVKIDRSFVRALAETPEAGAIVRAVVDLGRALRMEVTAEGVETHEQHRFLREIGCDRLQGFLFSRPVAAAEIDRLVVGHGHREPAPA
jgi:predicted signal transduction protein with EAL and GGDEF domain